MPANARDSGMNGEIGGGEIGGRAMAGRDINELHGARDSNGTTGVQINGHIDQNDLLEYAGLNTSELLSSATLLAHDLNDLLEVNMNEIPETMIQYPSHLPPATNLVPGEESEPPSAVETEAFVKTAFDDNAVVSLIAAFDMVPGQKNYLRLFYEKYSLWIMSLAGEGSENYFGKIIIHEAQRVPFLLNAILAMTASFEFKQTSSQIDDINKKYYLNLCLKGLTTLFGENPQQRPPSRQEMDLIEPLILTSLILVTDSASTINGLWRNHLKGANDLFQRYMTSRKHSPIILLAATWFAAFEIVSVMTNPMGGSNNTPQQLDDILSPILYNDSTNISVQFGFMLPNGYNVFTGQSTAGLRLIFHFLKVNAKIRHSESQTIDSDDLAKLMRSFDEAFQSKVASISGLIEPTNCYYPKAKGLRYLPKEVCGYTDKNDQVFSWFDICCQINLRGIYLVVLTNPMYLNLPIQSRVVQDVVKKILTMCFFFNGIDFNHFSIEDSHTIINHSTNLKDRRLHMLQATFLVCGLCCVDEVDKLKVQLYLKSLIKRGAKTVENSYKKLLDYWSGHESNFDFIPYL